MKSYVVVAEVEVAELLEDEELLVADGDEEVEESFVDDNEAKVDELASTVLVRVVVEPGADE